MKPLYLFFLLAIFNLPSFSQDSLKVLTLSNVIGDVINRKEKIHYNLFPQYSNEKFQSAAFFMKPDSSILLRFTSANGKTGELPYSWDEFKLQKIQVEMQVQQEEQKRHENQQTVRRRNRERNEFIADATVDCCAQGGIYLLFILIESILTSI